MPKVSKISVNKPILMYDTTEIAVELAHYYPKLINLKQCHHEIAKICSLTPRSKQIIDVYISSTNPDKINVLKNIYAIPHDIFIHASNCPSGINNQPFGIEQIRKGAVNRTAFLKKLIKDKNTNHVFSMENGICKSEGKYHDIGICLICDTEIMTDCTSIEDKYVNQSKQSGFKKTAGSLLETENNYSTCWIDHVRPDKLTRTQLYINAINKRRLPQINPLPGSH